jgi:hypothetical protein
MPENAFNAACPGIPPGHAAQPCDQYLGGIVMRYCLAILMLFVAPPAMHLLAAPIPAPSAILEIEPPPKGESMEKHLEYVIDHYLTDPYGRLFAVWLDPEISRLHSVAAKKNAAHFWLSRNIRVTKEGGRRLRLTFRGGNRQEQVAIINTLLRVYIQVQKKEQESLEDCLRDDEKCIRDLEQRIASGQHRESVDDYRQGIEELRSIRIPARRADIDRLKQIASDASSAA